MTALYNCHTDGLSHRITKFIDGNPEASYLTSRDACDCPAGHRASCRHRQMLPEFLNRNLVDTHLFIVWDLPSQPTCDFEGNTMIETGPVTENEYEAWADSIVPKGLHGREDTLTAEDIEALPDGLEKDYQHEMQQLKPAMPWRRL